MSEAVQKFDISDVIRIKVREMFKDIIPDTVLDEYLNREVKGFFSDKIETDWNGHRIKEHPHSSPFALFVHEEVLAYLKSVLIEKIREKINVEMEAFGVEQLADLIGKAKARYDAEITVKLYSEVMNNIPYQIGNIARDLEARKQ